MSFLFGRRRASTPSQRRASTSSATSQERRPSQLAGDSTSSSPGFSSGLAHPPDAHTSPSQRSTSHALDQLRSHVRDDSPSAGSESSRSRQRGGFGSSSAPAGPGYTTSSPSGIATSSPTARANTPPPYAHHSLDRSPMPNPLALDDRPRVPPPIYLRSSSNQPQSKLGTLTIHVPGWGIALVRPPRQYDLHPLESGGGQREPPAEDTVLSGLLEINMKERRRVQAISVGVQSVTRLNIGGVRGWEEDGIFERGVEVLTGDEEEGIWLEKGSQSFSFSILLPATLATHDYHAHGRVSYIITARVQGRPAPARLGSLFKTKDIPVQGEVWFLADFQAVINRSDRLAAEQAHSMSRTGSHEASPSLSPPTHAMGAFSFGSPPLSPQDEVAIALNDSAVPSRGLYHRRLSSDMNISELPTGQSRPSPLRKDTDQSSLMSRSSSQDGSSRAERSEKLGWLVGDICCIRSFKVHANPAPSGGAYQLDLRKEGYVEGLGPWRMSASSDAFSIASVMLVQVAIPSPSPACTIFFVRLILSQTYELYSPRRPNDPPVKPEATKNHVVYQVGRPHKHGEDVLAHDVEALWRGPDAGGSPKLAPSSGWRTRAVSRLPNHEKIRPSTNPGTITPIRVHHEFLLRIFYSIEDETVAGKPLRGASGRPRQGPGEVRMCQVRMPVIVPSCLCSTATLNLPTYECAKDACERENDLDPLKMCQCATSFAELSASALKKTNGAEEEAWATGGSTEERRTDSDGGKQREAQRT